MNHNEPRSKGLLHQCKICGAVASHSNFGAITCSPCKMFFKRNAEIGQKQFKCDFGGNCEINIINRRICPYCRLTKCFGNGMQIELIRGSTSKKNTNKKPKEINKQSITTNSNFAQLPTLNLLQTDQSILTIDQWKLFSNLMLSFDEHSVFSLAERYIFQQNILPIKLRFKSASVQQLLSTFIQQIAMIYEKNPHFLFLDSHHRSKLLHHQMKYLIILCLSFIIEKSHLINYQTFLKTIENLFDIMIILRHRYLCFDISFIKLSFGIILFSSFDDDDYCCYSSSSSSSLSIKLNEIQNMYIELSWRYLIYVYDEKQAINYFVNLIEYLLVIIDKMIVFKNRKDLMKMIDMMIKQTEQSFIVNTK